MIRRLILAALFVLAASLPSFAVGCAGTGNCYWIGGSGNASSTTNWATTDGGVTTGSIPTTADNCNFTVNSSAISYTVTIDAATSCKDVVWANPLTGSPTLAGTSTITMTGSLTLVSGMTWSLTGNTNFTSTSTGKTITSAGVSIASTFAFNGSGGGWTLQDDLSIPGKTITVTNGTFNSNGKTITVAVMQSLSGTRTLTLTGSTIVVTRNVTASGWNFATAGTLTLSAPATITFNGVFSAGTTVSFDGAGKSYNILQWVCPTCTGTLSVTGANTFTSFIVSPGAAKILQLPASTTQTVTTLKLAGESDSLLSLTSSSPGTKATISVAAGTQVNSYLSVNDSAATGGATFYAAQSVDNGTNTGWTFGNPPLTQGGSFMMTGVGP